ncbi:BTAD domain-containing putative transcriptional regulator [Actinoplanes sp. NPDC024001]|uniref:BTAD domain-containing putative transcriptional regulator n=1 Tax=Actinoplanes sp. NPDC024001 TaxID=3154598 RepID=UPI0033F1039A
MKAQTPAGTVTFGVLGPIEAANQRGEIALRGARQRAVLARLLIARRRVVPVDQLITDLWEEPSDGAVGAIRTFVGDLRRALEPDRPPRRPPTLLVTAPPGYALHADLDAVDAWRFEEAVARSRDMLAAGQAATALARLDAALAMWRGPAYPEWTGEPWARGEIDRLGELRLLAVERRAEALLDLGRAEDAVTDLRAHVAAFPLREDAWQLLATALYRSGRQGEALGALRRARETLVAELGVDPGVRLRRLENDILVQAPHLIPSAEPAVVSPGVDAPGPAAADPRPLIGREDELAQLATLADDVAARHRPRLALISGDPGSGKSALAETLAQRLQSAGWLSAWGHGPEHAGAPIAWPATQIAAALGTSDLFAGTPAQDPVATRFHLHRAVVSLVEAAAARAPVLLVFDDLHHMDEDTLGLITALVSVPEAVRGPVLVLGTFRAAAITPLLTAALASFARTEPARFYLGGLTERATGELAHAVTGRTFDDDAVRILHRRSGGNPFFVRELARVLHTDGRAALNSVPAGVRDVIRHRLAQLPEAAQQVLRKASILGRDVDPEVLSALVDDETGLLDAVEGAVHAGFLTERAEQLRFTHILVRDTLYEDLSALRRARWHAIAGAAAERLHPHDVAVLAHHFDRAATRDTAPRAARYARAAAEQAERRAGSHEAARFWRQAVAAHDRADDGDVAGRLVAVMGWCRALAVTGHLDEARRHRAAAIDAAEDVGDAALTADVLAAFDVPAIWTSNDDEVLSARVVDVARRCLRELPADDLHRRSRLLSLVALESRGIRDGRGDDAAREAEVLARRSGDPALLSFALNARFMHTFGRCGLAAERAAIGAELVAVADRHELVTFQVLGHLIRLQAHSALGDLTAADADAAAVDALAARYDLPLAAAFTGWYRGLRLAVDGRPAAAETAYREADAHLRGSGIAGMEPGLLPLALLALRLGVPGPDPGDLARHHDEWARTDWGPHEPWVRPLVLLAGGRRAEAAAALRALPASPHDLLREARACLTARAALLLDDREVMRRAHAELLPAADELAAGTGVFSLGPVAAHLRAMEAAGLSKNVEHTA